MAWRELKKLSGKVGNTFKVEYDSEGATFRVVLSGSTVKEGLEALPDSVKAMLRNPKTAQELLMDLKSLSGVGRTLVNGWIDAFSTSVHELAMWRHIPRSEAQMVEGILNSAKAEFAKLTAGNDFWLDIIELYQRGNLENDVVLLFDADNGKIVLRIGRDDVLVSKGWGNDLAYACGLMRCAFTAVENGVTPERFKTWIEAVKPRLQTMSFVRLKKEITRLLLLMPDIPPEYQDQHAPVDDENETIGERVAKRRRTSE